MLLHLPDVALGCRKLHREHRQPIKLSIIPMQASHCKPRMLPYLLVVMPHQVQCCEQKA